VSFDAGSEVEPLDYNFDTIAKRYPGRYPELEGVTGTVPEPSDDAVQTFQRRLTAATVDLLPVIDMDDRVAVAKALRDMPEETFAKADQTIIDAVGELCAGSPTREQIAALPFRLRRKFVAWLQRELMNPESLTAATRP
jgi:hypothetical protein